MTEIGATLREERMRARIDISEIEAQTKIRAKYLRALENEEWDLLPGPTFVKSFLRTYAQALGLDGKALVEEFRLSHERPSESDLQPIVSTARGARQRNQRNPPPRWGPSRAYLAGIGAVGVIVVLLIVGLLSDGGSSKNPTTTTNAAGHTSTAASITGARHSSSTRSQPAPGASSSTVTLSLRPSAEVYVCLLGEGGKRLIPGTTLKPGAAVTTYHSKHFVITLGNSSVQLLIDGKPRVVPPSSNAIGYSITKAGRRVLAANQLPTCK
jgi:cytoskeleton protein RodZ